MKLEGEQVLLRVYLRNTDLPIVIEIMDTADKVQALLPFLDGAVAEGLITIEDVRVLKYRHNPQDRRG